MKPPQETGDRFIHFSAAGGDLGASAGGLVETAFHGRTAYDWGCHYFFHARFLDFAYIHFLPSPAQDWITMVALMAYFFQTSLLAVTWASHLLQKKLRLQQA
jgi:hypothetical protein